MPYLSQLAVHGRHRITAVHLLFVSVFIVAMYAFYASFRFWAQYLFMLSSLIAAQPLVLIQYY